ncbi:MAG: hypothetical protein ACI9O2_000398, partial [Flammeovirgaceae bacterium]
TRILINYGSQEIEVDIQSEEGEDEKVKVQVAEYILHDLLTDEISFKSEMYKSIIERFRTHFDEEGSFPSTEKLVRSADLSEAVAAMISSPYELSENWAEKHRIYTDTEEVDLRRTVFDPLMRLKLSKIKTLIHEVDEAIKNAESEEELNLHLQEKIKLGHMKVQLSDFFGSTII